MIDKIPADIQARLKKPSERTEPEKKAIDVSSLASEEEVPQRVLTKLARDEDFKEWAVEKPEFMQYCISSLYFQ